VERIDVNPLGAADLVTVNDLSATDVSAVNVDLAVTLGSDFSDGQADRVAVNGTKGDDTIDVGGDASVVAASGLSAQVTIEHQDTTSDELVVDGSSGDDRISAAALAAQAIALTLDGNVGDDSIAGGAGAETMRGDDGNDSIDGNRGNDVAFMGADDDTFVWDPGDGSDTVEGQDGADTMVFNGAGNGQTIDLSANGSRLKLVRNLGNVTMDTDGVEQIDVNPLGAADLVTVNDLSATVVGDVNVDLAGSLGGAAGDGQSDHVVVNGTDGDDMIDVSGDAAEAKVSGLATTVAIRHSEAAKDRLDIDTRAGTDSVDSVGLAPGTIQLFVDGILIP
jgi:Ca2+-binding RTX toxin-like protein